VPETDSALIARAQRGDDDAFGELYDRYRAYAHRAARTAGRDRARAEEIVQDAFASIWRSRATYKPDRPSASGWVLRVVRNRAIDVARHDAPYEARRVSDTWLEHIPAPHDVAGEALGRVTAGELRALLVRLPTVQREAIVLAFYVGLSQAEIADRLDVPLGTVKARIRRGLRALHAELDQDAA